MSDLFVPVDARDPRLALGAPGLLGAFNAAGVITSADVHVARALGEVCGEQNENVLLAAALTTRAVRTGSVCLDLRLAGEDVAQLPGEETGEETAPAEPLPWPEPASWLAEVGASRPVAAGVLRLDGDLLYLDRYHQQETQVLDDLLTRASTVPEHDLAALETSLARVFPIGAAGDTWTEQRAACRTAVTRWTTVITGGPGTGKTTAVAGLLVALRDQHQALTPHAGQGLRIALAAPTGKAAARLRESVQNSARHFCEDDRSAVEHLAPSTLHRLLRRDPGNSTRFRYHRHNRLPYDVVVVDEASMVSLTMMARLLEAMRPDARLVLVGDPDQLSSVDAGAVLGDLVSGYGAAARAGVESPVAALRTTHRFSDGIARLASALREGDADAVLAALGDGHPLAAGSPELTHDSAVGGNGLDVEWVDTSVLGDAGDALHDLLLGHAATLGRHGVSGDARAALDALEEHRLLCAHRDGPYGVRRWNQRVEQWLTASGSPTYDPFYVGRPVLVTANDYGLGLHNGDSGVVVHTVEGRRVVIDHTDGPRSFAPARMSATETMHAMTIHKSQGSQARAVTVLLPAEDSRLLTRELLYTAVTRAQKKVRVVGSEAEVRAAVERTARRASGLAERLQARLPHTP